MHAGTSPDHFSGVQQERSILSGVGGLRSIHGSYCLTPHILSIWNPYFVRDTELLERTQRFAL